MAATMVATAVELLEMDAVATVADSLAMVADATVAQQLETTVDATKQLTLAAIHVHDDAALACSTDSVLVVLAAA
ncbi:MAG: hypothetical protein KF851_06920 [Pirellulaceae bacterium]|nr:hypothetical protein [Pirellulaceae bacterium]